MFYYEKQCGKYLYFFNVYHWYIETLKKFWFRRKSNWSAQQFLLNNNSIHHSSRTFFVGMINRFIVECIYVFYSKVILIKSIYLSTQQKKNFADFPLKKCQHLKLIYPLEVLSSKNMYNTRWLISLYEVQSNMIEWMCEWAICNQKKKF